MKDIDIEFLGGNCPVQGEGRIDGVEFYFRARGDHWSIGIGGDVVREPDWYYEEPFGEWPEAGWMEESQALAFIEKAAGMWREKKNRK